MPVYEYVCEPCGKATELLRAMRDADAPAPCEHCGGRTSRAQSVVAVGSTVSGGSEGPMAGCGRCGDPRGSCGMN